MRILFLFAVVAVFPTFVFSQSNFKPAFIVKNNGDTVRGFIEEGDENKISSTVSFKTDAAQDPPQYLTTADIFSFGFYGGNVFKRIAYTNPTENKQYVKFAKYLLKGYNSLYVFQKDDRSYFIIKNEQDSTYLLYDDSYTSSGSYVQAGNFKNILLFISGSCDKLKTRIGELSFSEKELIEFVSNVNACVAPSAASEVLYKKPKTEFHMYAYGGGIYLGDNHEITARVMGRFTLPSVDRKTSLNAGINFMQHYQTKYVYIAYAGNYLGTKTKEMVTTSFVAIPVTVQYYFTTGKVQPYFDAGFCYIFRKQSGELNEFRKPTSFSDNGPSYIVALGIDYNVNKNLSVKGEWREEYLLHYPTIGIAYFFK